MLGHTEKNLFGDDLTITNDDDRLFQIIFNLPINWVGNKKRLLNRLLVFMNEHKVCHNSFFDVFSGSGVVSMLAASSGKTVFSNDLLILSTTWLMQVVSGRYNPLSVDDVEKLLADTKSLFGKPKVIGFLSQLYNGALLTAEEVAYLDAYRLAVANNFGPYLPVGNRLFNNSLKPAYINLYDQTVTFDPVTGNPDKVGFAMQMMCVHILQQAFMGGRCYKSQLLSVSEKRLKDGKIKMTGNSNSIGNQLHLIKLLSPKTCPTKAICDFLKDIRFKSNISNCDAESLLLSGTVSADIAYFDPPYGGCNSDYAWMYRVCEEFLTGRRLEDCEDLREASVKFKGDDYERDKVFAKKKRIGYAENFSNLLSASKDFPCWMISFNESSFSSIKDIVEIVSSFRIDPIVETVNGYRYNYRDNSAKAGSEYIILARSR